MRITVSSCPHCGKVLDVAMNKFSDGPLGRRSFVKCSHCGGLIWNGQDEWSTFSTAKKVGYFIQMGYSGIFWGLGLGALAGGLSSNIIGGDAAVVLGILIFVAICVLFAVSAKRDIAGSQERAARASNDAAEESIVASVLPVFVREIESLSRLRSLPEVSTSSDEKADRFFGSSIASLYAAAFLVVAERGVGAGLALNKLRYAAIDATIWHLRAVPDTLRAPSVPPSVFKAKTNGFRQAAATPLIELEKQARAASQERRLDAVAACIAGSYGIMSDVLRVRSAVEEARGRILADTRASVG